jgi:hypothetical protein
MHKYLQNQPINQRMIFSSYTKTSSEKSHCNWNKLCTRSTCKSYNKKKENKEIKKTNLQNWWDDTNTRQTGNGYKNHETFSISNNRHFTLIAFNSHMWCVKISKCHKNDQKYPPKCHAILFNTSGDTSTKLKLRCNNEILI